MLFTRSCSRCFPCLAPAATSADHFPARCFGCQSWSRRKLPFPPPPPQIQSAIVASSLSSTLLLPPRPLHRCNSFSRSRQQLTLAHISFLLPNLSFNDYIFRASRAEKVQRLREEELSTRFTSDLHNISHRCLHRPRFATEDAVHIMSLEDTISSTKTTIRR